MIVRSLELENFRKFREPLLIDRFTNGFNIVVEPNETGKSTLLEALRAAFFIRHSARTELVRSYMPLGDDVAPRVAVAFEVAGAGWTLEKRFMRSPHARLAGPGRRFDSDAAEEQLQALLGFERGNNRGSDPETRGPLGMLWVEQASALEVAGPNRIVRDTVRGVLESEIGAVTGGKRFDTIRARIDEAYLALRTASTRQSRGELQTAERRLATSREKKAEAEAALRSFEQALGDLEGCRSRLSLLERDIADADGEETRKRLEEDLRLAESAALRLSAAEAHHGQADAVAKSAVTKLEMLDRAERRLAQAELALGSVRAAHSDASARNEEAVNEESEARQTLARAREELTTRKALLTTARTREAAFVRSEAIKRALQRLDSLGSLEERERELAEITWRGIEAQTLTRLAELDRAALQARARFDAGTVRVELDLAPGTQLSLDGLPSDATVIEVTRPVTLTVGDAGSVTVRPPEGSGRSLEADLAAAEAELSAALTVIGEQSYAAAVGRAERARAAAAELESVRRQIAAACPADPGLGLAAGAAALRTFVATLGPVEVPADAPADDIVDLESMVADAHELEAVSLGRHEEARAMLARKESALAAATSDLASATREVEAAGEGLRQLLAEGSREELQSRTQETARDAALRLEALEEARRAAATLDVEAIRRRLANLTRAATRAAEERLELLKRIAGLEATVARDGTAGPAGALAEAVEEERSAIAAFDRLSREADVLELLRDVLADAASQASRTFLAPVTRRAVRYVQRLLPGCDLEFGEDLALSSVVRGGVGEGCAGLSRGTQEQLAILTRLAFADLLLDDGAPISLILDDPLVYSDDGRLETMTDILSEASEKMQVILLTCRAKAFRHVEANRITI